MVDLQALDDLSLPSPSSVGDNYASRCMSILLEGFWAIREDMMGSWLFAPTESRWNPTFFFKLSGVGECLCQLLEEMVAAH